MSRQHIFTATVRAAGGAHDPSCERRFAALLAGDIWRPQDVSTVDGDDLLLEAYISFDADSFIGDPDSELDSDEQARLYAADELEDRLAGTGFELSGDVEPSESF